MRRGAEFKVGQNLTGQGHWLREIIADGRMLG
jgi:hypothetical protein